MEFNFILTEQDAQIVLNALTKEPYGLVAEVIGAIQAQASEQMAKETKTTRSSSYVDTPNTGV